MPSAKKSKSKSRNTSTHKTKCRFCRAKCVGQNVCKNCRDTNCHYKLELLDDAIQKGEINEGEYLRQCKHLKEIRELDELAKGITTFDTENTENPLIANFHAGLTQAEIQERIPEGRVAVRIPRHITAMGMGAVDRYARLINQENTAMNEVMDVIGTALTRQRHLVHQQAGDVCGMIASAIIDKLQSIYTETTYTIDIEWHDWLREAYNNNVNENVLRAGFPFHLNSDVNYSFDSEAGSSFLSAANLVN